MKPQELINARYTARISKTKDAGRIYMFLSILSDLEPGTYKHELTAEAVRDAVRNARTSPRRVLTEMIREAMTGQPKAVQILILLTLCLIVLAAVSLIVGLLAGAKAAVFLTVPLATFAPGTRGYYLNQLPEPYRTQALDNTRAQREETVLNQVTDSLDTALMISFAWDITPQGAGYWSEALKGNYPQAEPTNKKIERLFWYALFAALAIGAMCLIGHTVDLVLSLAAAPLMLTRGPLETTNSLQVAADTGIAFEPLEIHGSAGTYHDMFDRDLYDRESDWSRLINKLGRYDHTPLINLIAGQHDFYRIEVTDKIYGTLLITFNEPINVYFGSVGDKPITHPVNTMTGRISWSWSGQNEFEIIINDLKYIS